MDRVFSDEFFNQLLEEDGCYHGFVDLVKKYKTLNLEFAVDDGKLLLVIVDHEPDKSKVKKELVTIINNIEKKRSTKYIDRIQIATDSHMEYGLYAQDSDKNRFMSILDYVYNGLLSDVQKELLRALLKLGALFTYHRICAARVLREMGENPSNGIEYETDEDGAMTPIYKELVELTNIQPPILITAGNWGQFGDRPADADYNELKLTGIGEIYAKSLLESNS